MNCPECHAENPEFSQYCHRCGHGLRGTRPGGHGRTNSYAVHPGESVFQLSVVSTVMPHSNRETADNYRWALLITGAITLAFTLAGILPAAILAAAFLVPLVYLVYIYDVNLWEETPLSIVAGVMGVVAILSTIVSIVFFRWIFDARFLGLIDTGARGGGLGGIDVLALFLFVLLLPVIAEICKQAPAIAAARMERYNDQIDALTLGVAAGTTYAAFETVVAYAPVFASDAIQTSDGLVSWLVVIFNLMIVKSLIYGTATGIAVAAFSGRGEAVDGFKPSYWSHAGLAVGANILYWLGVRLLVFAPFGQALGLLWGLVILGLLIVRIRVMLQSALLEAAVEAAVEGRTPTAASQGESHCPNCEMQLLSTASFCVICGMSVKAASHQARSRIRTPNTAVGGGR